MLQSGESKIVYMKVSACGGQLVCIKTGALGLYSVMLTVAGNDRLECHTTGFRVTDTRGTVLFSADKNEVVVGAEVLRVTGQLILLRIHD
jgi:hypothetical protein